LTLTAQQHLAAERVDDPAAGLRIRLGVQRRKRERRRAGRGAGHAEVGRLQRVAGERGEQAQGERQRAHGGPRPRR
jgi:hypothetical protein